MRADRLRAASRRVREESMRVNAEFDAIEDWDLSETVPVPRAGRA